MLLSDFFKNRIKELEKDINGLYRQMRLNYFEDTKLKMYRDLFVRIKSLQIPKYIVLSGEKDITKSEHVYSKEDMENSDQAQNLIDRRVEEIHREPKRIISEKLKLIEYYKSEMKRSLNIYKTIKGRTN